MEIELTKKINGFKRLTNKRKKPHANIMDYVICKKQIHYLK